MNDIRDCNFMEIWCLQRAEAEPENAWRWMGQAQRWRDLAPPHAVKAKQMTGPMQMGPNPITGARPLQQS